MEKERTFRIKDFYQSAVLKASGFPLIRLEGEGSRFVIFVFSDPENRAEELLRNYWNREVKVIARDLVEAINELKTRIHSKTNYGY